MDDIQFQSVLADVAAGCTPTDACLKVLSTSAHLMKYLSEHPDGMVYQAALLQSEGDARISKSDRMLEKLSERVGEGFVTTPAVARIETDQINKLRTEGFNMRERATRQLAQLHKAERQRVADEREARVPKPSGRSWLDGDVPTTPVSLPSPPSPAQAPARQVEQAVTPESWPEPVQAHTPTPEEPWIEGEYTYAHPSPRAASQPPNPPSPAQVHDIPSVQYAAHDMSMEERLAAITIPSTMSTPTDLSRASPKQNQPSPAPARGSSSIDNVETIDGKPASLMPASAQPTNTSWIL